MTAVVLLLGDGAGGTPPVTQTVLSTTNKASDVILSNGDRDAETSVTAGGIVLSDSGKTTGKFYAECQLMQLAASRAFAFGLYEGTSSLTTYLGGNTSGWGTWVVDAIRRTRHNTVEGYPATTVVPVVNIRARMAVDLSAGNLWLSQFGSTAWMGGGDPAAGTSPSYSFTTGGTFYIALCPYHGVVTPTTSRNRLRLVLPADWASAAPSGFGVWTP